MTLGSMSAFSEAVALTVVASGGIPPLVGILEEDEATDATEVRVKSAVAWSLGEIGRHSPEHAKALSDASALPTLVSLVREPSSEDLHMTAADALKAILERSVQLASLEPFVDETLPEDVLTCVVNQFAKVLPHDASARRSLVTSGGLQKMLELQPEPESKLGELLRSIKECYPKEMVDYYSPNYSEKLLDTLDASSGPAVV